MPVQAPQWTEFLLCPICTQTFEETVRRPISLGCGHTVCKMCLNKLHRKACPFDQTAINTDIEQLPVNTALLQLVGGQVRHMLCFLFYVDMYNGCPVFKLNTQLKVRAIYKIVVRFICYIIENGKSQNNSYIYHCFD